MEWQILLLMVIPTVILNRISVYLLFKLQTLLAISCTHCIEKRHTINQVQQEGKPKFCPFRLSPICKDSAEVEVCLAVAGLKHLISSVKDRTRRPQSDIFYFCDAGSDAGQNGNLFCAPLEVFLVIVDSRSQETPTSFRSSDVAFGRPSMQIRTSNADGFRISVSSTPSCSSHNSGPDDIESLGDVYLWGEVYCDGTSGDGPANGFPSKTDFLIPKPLESNVVIDVQQIACGVRHFALVTRQGEIFTCGEESGGRLGHGIDRDIGRPRLVEFLAVTNVDSVACGEYHTCAVSTAGDLYTWGDGSHNAGLLGHGTEVSHWIPKRVSGPLEGLQVFSVACGNWHSALSTVDGKLFTFGDGTFGALGHGDRESVRFPKEVTSLTGLKTIKVACGIWHTAAIIEITNPQSGHSMAKKLFTWGDGDKYRLGHGNKETFTEPTCVAALIDYNFHQLACGHTMTVALTTSGHVFTMGSPAHGQLGNPHADGKSPCMVQDKLVGEFVEEIACGAYHVAVLTSRSEVYTWGMGANGRLGHGDMEDRTTPTLVESFKDRLVKGLSCGASYTASICVHKWVSGADQSVCSGCRQAFGFTRKRHNCYNCGLVHCHGCSSRKALKAALAPTPGKPHRVCDSCYIKLKKAAESGNNNNNVSGFNRRLSAQLPMDGSRLDRHGRTSRILISPIMEPVKYHEVKSGRYGSKPDSYSIVRASQVPAFQNLKDVAFPSSLSALHNSLRPGTVNQQFPPHPQPQRPASPHSRRPSSPRSGTPIFSRGMIDGLNKSNDLLNQEVSRLQNQVKSLKQKSDKQDAAIRKLRNNAKQAESLAAEKTAKCNLAVDVFKCIISQLNGLTEKLPPEISNDETFKALIDEVNCYVNTYGSDRPSSCSPLQSDQPDESCSSSEVTRKKYHKIAENEDANEGNKSTKEVDGAGDTSQIVDGSQDASQSSGVAPLETNESSATTTEAESQKSIEGSSGISKHRRKEGVKEVIEQFEPGVYVTLLQLSDGTKIFKRVRFSRRRFAEQQAEEWWKENKERLLKRYSQAKPRSAKGAPPAAPPPPPPT
ncbi:hypothetical protein L6452_32594 [Arctium lappa]|uniref:Uncharacterized protein n=1 Tax=Arctium lappa TaxID=4217 RepID=A0ACB8Z5W4_ARCLA|nr:hypothetical protein L6452_32594 [Arctium lappa]